MTKKEPGECENDTYSCYVKSDYWTDLNKSAEGPILSIIEGLPEGVKELFYSPILGTATETVVSPLQWEVAGEEWDKVDKTELKLENLKTLIETARIDDHSSTATTKSKVSLTDETINEMTIKESDYVTLSDGSNWIPTDIQSKEISVTESVVTVKDKLVFVSIVFLMALLMIVAIVLLI